MDCCHNQELCRARAGARTGGGGWTRRRPARLIFWRVQRPLLWPGMVLQGLRPEGGTGPRCSTWIHCSAFTTLPASTLCREETKKMVNKTNTILNTNQPFWETPIFQILSNKIVAFVFLEVGEVLFAEKREWMNEMMKKWWLGYIYVLGGKRERMIWPIWLFYVYIFEFDGVIVWSFENNFRILEWIKQHVPATTKLSQHCSTAK